MNKTQIKSKLQLIIDELEELQNEVEETRDNIEPYDGKDDLTEKQQERCDWLDEVVDSLDSAKSELEQYVE